MGQPISASPKRLRISVDVTPDLRRRLRLAAAKRDLSMKQYVKEALEERVLEDLGKENQELLILTGKADPVLEELWSNSMDSAYDRI